MADCIGLAECREPSYAKANGLGIEPRSTIVQGRPLHFLVNNKGQRFFSDMDLYEILDGATGRQVTLGSGLSPTQGIKNRRELDILINIVRRLGTDFALIQHGPERQWVRHDYASSPTESITVFCPDGSVFILPPHQINAFIHAAGNPSVSAQ